MKVESLKEIVEKKPYIFWDVKDIDGLSNESVIEAILTRGDFDDVLKLFDTLGMKHVAEIFFKQVSMKRTNYNKKAENFFRLFFKRHLGYV
ncbi:MAG: hypothetical protein HY878_04815 [Deltaproteobacteria bacterium]|nr:hypothetical protein [Deltaproteobacteria bacterium]